MAARSQWGSTWDARASAMLTAMTNLLLRLTVRRWFEHDKNVQDTRRKLDGFTSRFDAPPPGWAATPAGIAGPAPLHLIAPAGPLGPKAPLTLYFHGGGYIVGSLAGYLPFCARLGRAIGGPVLFADYRLAPEHPFPAAVEDGLAAFDAAAARAEGKFFVAGDSAGGGLALAVVHAAIAAGKRLPDGVILISPWADLMLSGRSIIENAATDAMLSAKILTRMRGLYLGEADPSDRRASPLLHAHTSLPPTLLIYSTTEILAADSVRLALKLRAGGTAVTEWSAAGKPHVFPLFKTVPGAGAALAAITAFANTSKAAA